MPKILNKFHLNIPKNLADHVVGEHHTVLHRRVAGSIVMVIGVGFAKLIGFLDHGFIHLVADIIGYGLHAVGLIPFISNLEKYEELNS